MLVGTVSARLETARPCTARAATAVGDVDGDGKSDFVVGVLDHGEDFPATLHLVYGRSERFSGSTPLDEMEDAVVMPPAGYGTWGEAIGHTWTLGDFDQDDADEWFIPGNFPSPTAPTFGRVAVLPGSKTRLSGTLAALDLPAAPVTARTSNPAGRIGDIDGDGRQDFLAGVDGSDGHWSLGLFYGSPARLDGDFRVSDADAVIDMADEPMSICSPGDMDGDGRADFAIGSEEPAAGVVYIVSGAEGPFHGHVALSDVAARWVGRLGTTTRAAGDGIGFYMGCGDVNGDGLGDVVVAAGMSNRAYLVLGRRR